MSQPEDTVVSDAVRRHTAMWGIPPAPRRYFQVTSTVGNVTRNVKCSDVSELLGLIDYEIGVGALSIAVTVEREKQP